MTKELKTLYSVFDLLNNQDISTSPSMSNPRTYYFNGILNNLQQAINGNRPITKTNLKLIQDFLKETNYCYYQPSEIREPIRINNCPYLTIVKELIEE